MVTRLPKVLTRKHAELAFERQQLQARLVEVEKELAALDFSIRVVSPTWAPPKRATRPKRKALLPHGAVSTGCLQLLRQQRELDTPELTRLIAARHRVAFASRQSELDFASSVAMALRRHERRGLVAIVGKDDRTGALRWRLNIDAEGRLTMVAQSA